MLNPTLTKFILLGGAGAAGALSRYALSGVIHRMSSSSFPLGTMIVNVVGCFLFGLVWTLAEERLMISGEMRVILLAGFMGAFTTFSTLAFETTQLIRNAEWTWAAVNLAGQNVLGIAVLVLGVRVGRLF